jgi:tetratricopeptide (TPR) repeat protein
VTPAEIIERRKQAMVFFKLGMKASSNGVHRTLNRPPKGKGWVQCRNSPDGVMCRPEKVREAIEHYKKSYSIFPDIVVLYQVALAYEMTGEFESAREHFRLLKTQAEAQANKAYAQGADQGLGRTAAR